MAKRCKLPSAEAKEISDGIRKIRSWGKAARARGSKKMRPGEAAEARRILKKARAYGKKCKKK